MKYLDFTEMPVWKLQYFDGEIGNDVENKILDLIKELNFLIKSIESKPQSQH